jgi:hypothetical protein
MEEEARATSQAQEKKDEGSLVSRSTSCPELHKANNTLANKRLAPSITATTSILNDNES